MRVSILETPCHRPDTGVSSPDPRAEQRLKAGQVVGGRWSLESSSCTTTPVVKKAGWCLAPFCFCMPPLLRIQRARRDGRSRYEPGRRGLSACRCRAQGPEQVAIISPPIAKAPWHQYLVPVPGRPAAGPAWCGPQGPWTLQTGLPPVLGCPSQLVSPLSPVDRRSRSRLAGPHTSMPTRPTAFSLSVVAARCRVARECTSAMQCRIWERPADTSLLASLAMPTSRAGWSLGPSHAPVLHLHMPLFPTQARISWPYPLLSLHRDLT